MASKRGFDFVLESNLKKPKLDEINVISSTTSIVNSCDCEMDIQDCASQSDQDIMDDTLNYSSVDNSFQRIFNSSTGGGTPQTPTSIAIQSKHCRDSYSLSGGKCDRCKVEFSVNSTDARQCSFCAKVICYGCSIDCARCCDLFCLNCATINYDMPYPRNMCLDCPSLVRCSSLSSSSMDCGSADTAGQGRHAELSTLPGALSMRDLSYYYTQNTPSMRKGDNLSRLNNAYRY
jgi:hypothetical protein